MFEQQIETKDLILKKAELKDLENIYKNFYSENETAKFMLWKPCESLEEAKVFLEKAIRFQKDKPAFFVYLKKTNEAIGIAGMMETEEGVFEDCGIGIGKLYVGKGYGKQILNALLNYCKNELKAKKFVCSCFAENVSSAKMQKSCGFVYTHSENKTRKWDNLAYTADYYELEF